jgi:hypothetical protein
MRQQRRACVIGSQGALGRVAVEALRATGWSVHPAGRRPDGHADFRLIDLQQPSSLGPALEEVDLVLSTVPDPGLVAERWVMEHGGLLVNCSHAPGAAAARLTKEIGARCTGTVLLNGGLVPGVANLIAADLLDRHPEADTLEVAFTVLREGTSGRGGGEFVHAGLAARSRHRTIELAMPAPFGELRCIEIHESGDCGFAGVADGRRVRNYLGFGDRPAAWTLRAANALGLMRLLPRAAFTAGGGGTGPPSMEPTAIWIGVRRGQRLLGASTVECKGDYRVTAMAARLFGEALLANARLGCFNPEDLFELGDFASPLNEMGVRIAKSSH